MLNVKNGTDMINPSIESSDFIFWHVSQNRKLKVLIDWLIISVTLLTFGLKKETKKVFVKPVKKCTLSVPLKML